LTELIRTRTNTKSAVARDPPAGLPDQATRKDALRQQTNFVIRRNVKDYSAKGDGVTDDSDAINHANAEGNRCSLSCDSRLSESDIVYFTAGTYMISTPIIVYYNTAVRDDANNLLVLKVLPSFD
jgi:glucan 1,3-beta-glucosidase